MTQFNTPARLAKLRARMTAEGVDAFIAIKSANTEYLTGFDYIRDSSNPHVVLVTADEARFITDGRYTEVAEKQAKNCEIWTVDSFGDQGIKDLAKIWNLTSFNTIALEDSMSHRIFSFISTSVNSTESALGEGTMQKVLAHVAGPTEVIAAVDWVEEIRAAKDEAELARIKAAQAITDKTFSHMCNYLKAGLSEKDVANELEYTLRRLGADDKAFSPIVASGPNGSLPHAVPTDRVIEAGDLVTLDFGASLGGYCSDMTRTVFIGGNDAEGNPIEPTDEQRKVYNTVLAAQEASLAAFKEGTTGIEVDKAGRDIIIEAGYGDYFTHGTGHGIGLDIHELPNASPRSKTALPAGAVITCEPGIYLPGKLGVRIEDMVVITKDGAESITTSSKDLLII